MLSVDDLEGAASKSGRTGYVAGVVYMVVAAVAVAVTGKVVLVLILELLNHEMLLRGREEIQLG
jgi:hypothetical protein